MTIMNQPLEYYLEGLSYKVLCGDEKTAVSTVINDSRELTEGCLYLCIKGANFDGHSKLKEAVEKGASAALVQEDADPELIEEIIATGAITLVQVKDTRYAMAFVAAAFYGHPAKKLKTIGVTGTKGKTTTTYLVKSILENAGWKVGLVGTIEILTGSRAIPSLNTTPESFDLQAYFAEMVENGCTVVVMEVSSQGLMMHRTQGFVFDYGIFTNLESDHIGPNEHASFEDYLQCKSMLFRQCRVGILNGDDSHYEEILEGHTCEVETFGFGEKNDLRATNPIMVHGAGYLGVRFTVGGLMNYEVEADIPGKFSIYNVLTAMAICRHFGIEKEVVQQAVKEARVKGRIELVKVSDEFSLMIDYAHNAMSLESLLTTLREYEPGRLVCLFGCGGNRSKNRRYEMGEVSGRLADFNIITSDNPRFEEPLDIIADIRVGIQRTQGKYIEIPDRKEAIAYAIHNGRQGDIIVLAGKGHEDYQEIKGVKYPMDERILIAEIMEEDAKSQKV